MSATKGVDEVKDYKYLSIPELVDIKEWDYVLLRIEASKMKICYSDKIKIVECESAPKWLRVAVSVCKTMPSA
jgi:hypothetical protein